MDYKWIGAVLIVLGCGGYGFSIAAKHMRDLGMLRQLVSALDYMACELRCRMTPLPEVCRTVGLEKKGTVGDVLVRLGFELDTTLHPDVSVSMSAVLTSCSAIPARTRSNLQLLGNSLGRFDLEGQLTGLETVRSVCRQDIEELSADAVSRTRSYQTLGLCAGAALAILLI